MYIGISFEALPPLQRLSLVFFHSHSFALLACYSTQDPVRGRSGRPLLAFGVQQQPLTTPKADSGIRFMLYVEAPNEGLTTPSV
jgi:hypothetical protein